MIGVKVQNQYRVIFCLILLLSVFFSAWGQQGEASDRARKVKIYFRFDRSAVDSGFLNNRIVLVLFDRWLSGRESEVDTIFIVANSSPEGVEDYNQKLAERRAEAMKNYLLHRFPALKARIISKNIEWGYWKKLITVIESDPKVPYRNEVLKLLRADISYMNKDRGLKKLRGGVPYRYLVTRAFRYLRSATTVVVRKRVMEFPVVLKVEQGLMIGKEPDLSLDLGKKRILSPPVERVPLLALKTNLLFDLVTALNVELEIPLGKRWSIAGEWIFPWWLYSRKQYCLQLFNGNVEGRYWFGDRERCRVLTGWFAGVYAGGGLYDIEWKKKGYQGEFFIAAGVSGGYSHVIGKHLSLEYSLGVGYTRTRYRQYDAVLDGDDVWHLIRRRKGSYTWIGPTRAKVSLVWIPSFLYRKKRGGTR